MSAKLLCLSLFGILATAAVGSSAYAYSFHCPSPCDGTITCPSDRLAGCVSNVCKCVCP